MAEEAVEGAIIELSEADVKLIRAKLQTIESFVAADPARATELNAGHNKTWFAKSFRNKQQDIPLHSKEDYQLLDLVLQTQKIGKEKIPMVREQEIINNKLEFQHIENQSKLVRMIEMAGYKGEHNSLIDLQPAEFASIAHEIFLNKYPKDRYKPPEQSEFGIVENFLIQSLYSTSNGMFAEAVDKKHQGATVEFLNDEMIKAAAVLRDLAVTMGAKTDLDFQYNFQDTLNLVLEKDEIDQKAEMERAIFLRQKEEELIVINEKKISFALTAIENERDPEPEIAEEQEFVEFPHPVIIPAAMPKETIFRRLKRYPVVTAAASLFIGLTLFGSLNNSMKTAPASVKNPKMDKNITVKPVVATVDDKPIITPVKHKHHHYRSHNTQLPAPAVDSVLIAQNQTDSLGKDSSTVVLTAVGTQVIKSDSLVNTLPVKAMSVDTASVVNVTQKADSAKVTNLAVAPVINEPGKKIKIDSSLSAKNLKQTVPAKGDSNLVKKEVLKKDTAFTEQKADITKVPVKNAVVKNNIVEQPQVETTTAKAVKAVKPETAIQRKIAGVLGDMTYLQAQKQTRDIRRELDRKQKKLDALSDADHKDGEHRYLSNGGYIKPMSVKLDEAIKIAKQDSVSQSSPVKDNMVDIGTPATAKPVMKVNGVTNANTSNTGGYSGVNYISAPQPK